MAQSWSNRILDRSGAPAFTWLLCLLYVCYLLNHMFDKTLGAVPLTLLNGQMPDISPLLRFHFWQKVYFATPKKDKHYPSTSKEKVGFIVGISEHCGQAMTWKVYDPETKRVLPRSQCRPYSATHANRHADFASGERDSRSDPFVPIIKSRKDSTADNPVESSAPMFTDETYVAPDPNAIIDPDDLVG